MKKIVGVNNIYVAESKIPGAGRGVFAMGDIKKGETIEVCPLIVLSENDLSHTDETVLATYSFYFGERLNQAMIALGFGSIYNHNYQPNAMYEIKVEEQVMVFSALNNIKVGEEITVNYKSLTNETAPLWFE